jgi:hypothetical protein
MNYETYDSSNSPATRCDLEQLEAHIYGRLWGRVHDLRLVLRDRGLILQGRTHTYYAKQLAQHAVMEVTEVPLLANEIEVH